MKKILFPIIGTLFLFVPLSSLFSQTGFTVGVNLDFPNYNSVYLGPTLSFNPPLSKDLELNIGGTLGIYGTGENVQFNVPLKVGLNFLFPDDSSLTPYIGIGIMPAFNWTPHTQLNFMMGPYLTGGLRIKLHSLMSFFAEIDETLLIGPPAWINTSTRVSAGIAFRIAQ